MKKMVMGIAALLTLLAVVTGCGKFHRVEGNHHVITEARSVGGYTEIHSSGIFAVEISHDSIYALEIESEENLLPYIKTEVSGNILHLGVRDNRSLKPNYTIKVRIRMPHLSGVKLSGSGSIVADTFTTGNMDADLSGSGYISISTHATELSANISGSGEMDISGSAEHAQLKISGSGNLRASGLPAQHVGASISGSGDMYVYAIQSLDVDISGSGSVYYTGQPVITTHISGSGRLIHY